MSVGIMDADMSTYILVPFNLEVMKISSYYKSKGEIVLLSKTFSPERNKLFFYRKDYDDGIYPSNLNKDNVFYGGLAFSNGIYVPLKEEIEICKPDTSIYSKMEKDIMNTDSPYKKKIFQNLTNAEHCRLSLDGKNIWDKYPKQFIDLPKAENIIFHDVDLNKIDGSYEEIKRILNRARRDGKATRVGMKFPVQVERGEDLIKWINLRPNSTFYSLQYNGVIDNSYFIEFVDHCKEKSIYKQMNYCVTKGISQTEFTNKYIIDLFKQIIIARNYRVFYTLKYDENYFFDKNWEKVLDLFNFYHNSLSSLTTAAYLKKISNDTLFNFAENSTQYPPSYYKDKVMKKNEIREVFNFVKKANPELFILFYECNFNSLGGEI